MWQSGTQVMVVDQCHKPPAYPDRINREGQVATVVETITHTTVTHEPLDSYILMLQFEDGKTEAFCEDEVVLNASVTIARWLSDLREVVDHTGC